MILSPEDRIARNVESGAWLRVTMDQLFRRALQADPQAIAFQDAGSTSIPGVSSQLTYAEAGKRIDALAAFFAGIGLKPDMVLGLHLPACTDATIIALAAMRAGLVICPLPLHWGKTEIETAINAAAIRGIVTASEIEGEASGTLMRDVAADTFAIRFVFAVGLGLPDGLIDLKDVLADMDSMGPPPEITRRGSPADHIALVALARAPDDRLVVVPYSHNHIIACGIAHLLEGNVERQEHLLSTMHPASLASIGAGVAAALLVSGKVSFHHPTDLAGLLAAARDAKRVILPVAFGEALNAVLAPDIALSLVSTGFIETPVAALPGQRLITDFYTLGGLCLLPARRVAGQPQPVVHGPARMPLGNDIGTVLYESQIKARARSGKAKSNAGELLLAGALIPDSPWPEPASGGSGAVLSVSSDGQLRTGLQADTAADGLRISGAVDDSLHIAGHRLSMRRLDGIFARHPSIQDAAVFVMDGGLVGSRFGLAIVAKPDKRVRLNDLLAWLDETGAGALDRPSTVIVVPEIPRGQDGLVKRRDLFLQAVA